jgi:hypothetical protein
MHRTPRQAVCDPRRHAHRSASAAAYVGVSPTKFDELVKDGRMPRPQPVKDRAAEARPATHCRWGLWRSCWSRVCYASAPARAGGSHPVTSVGFAMGLRLLSLHHTEEGRPGRSHPGAAQWGEAPALTIRRGAAPLLARSIGNPGEGARTCPDNSRRRRATISAGWTETAVASALANAGIRLRVFRQDEIGVSLGQGFFQRK